MANEEVFNININDEIERYFDDSSLSRGEAPRLVILMGGPACGKTTLRKEHYAKGYVLVDAAEVFLRLSRGEFFPFPDSFEEPMQIIGSMVAKRAVVEKRHIVTEVIGADLELTKAFVDVMQAIGYRIDLQAITCDVEEAQRRNLSRGDDNISCYYTEPYQRGWLQAAAIATLDLSQPSDQA